MCYNIILHMERQGSTFAYHARYVLLTYAQSDGLDAQHVHDHIASLGAECVVSRENHADGHTHLHVFLDFGRTRRGRRHDQFDVDGYHPNIVPSRGRAAQGWDYATKDGDVVAGSLARPGGDSHESAEAKWSQIVEAGTRDEFFELVKRLDPKALVCNHSNVVKFADWKFRVEPPVYSSPDNLSRVPDSYPELDEWVRGNLQQDILGR